MKVEMAEKCMVRTGPDLDGAGVELYCIMYRIPCTKTRSGGRDPRNCVRCIDILAAL
jgi:hypothetical protein